MKKKLFKKKKQYSNLLVVVVRGGIAVAAETKTMKIAKKQNMKIEKVLLGNLFLLIFIYLCFLSCFVLIKCIHDHVMLYTKMLKTQLMKHAFYDHIFSY